MWVRGLKLAVVHAADLGRHTSHPMWVRELKFLARGASHMTNWVAPHVGAWIEIIILSMTAIVSWPSHPMWVRGLKLAGSAQRYAVALVAPHVGAWIERCHAAVHSASFATVAPHVGAWIESGLTLIYQHYRRVAPHVGAWIEICPSSSPAYPALSHPMWVRGLK